MLFNTERTMKEHFTPGTHQLLTIKQFAEKNPWPKEGTLRFLYANKAANGMQKAFKRWGRRILVDEEEFFRVIKASPSTLDKKK